MPSSPTPASHILIVILVLGLTYLEINWLKKKLSVSTLPLIVTFSVANYLHCFIVISAISNTYYLIFYLILLLDATFYFLLKGTIYYTIRKNSYRSSHQLFKSVLVTIILYPIIISILYYAFFKAFQST